MTPGWRGGKSSGRSSSLRRDALLTAGAAVGNTGLSAAASVVIARELGVAGRGTSATILSIAVLCGTVATIGLPAAASYALARVDVKQRAHIAIAAITSSLGLGLLAGIASFVITSVNRPPGASTLALAAGAGVAAALVAQRIIAQLVLTGTNLQWYAATQISPAAATLVAVSTIALVGHLRVTAAVALSCGGSLIGALVGLLALGSHRLLLRSWWFTGPRAAFVTLRPYVGYAAMLFVVTSLAQVVQRIDIVLVEYFRGPQAAGLYTIASQLGDVMLVIPAALGALVFRLGARSEIGHWDDTMKAITWTGAIGLVSGAFLAVGAHTLIVRLFGEQYAGSTLAFRLLIPGVVLLGAQSVLSNYIASRGRLRAVLGAWLTAAGLGVGLDVIAIPIGGITAAAVVSSVSYFVVLGLHVRALRSLPRT